ncbi:phospholipase D-like domain-containing protein [Mycolicibacterium komossense]|uniref:phospholipase D n=1 Tax=Mycolicibacterium komossense TaxID=1779 RepID=A0ABT3CET7_9MYCO|nr:phospholipase D-like domain-containing protein [Mycolicibacterium komossense]MCV7227990.1 phospholipase [Mycolicibacterium komossense]
MSRSLIILPEDSARPVVDAIAAATSSIRVKMFAFSHPPLLDAVLAAHRRGVRVRVMLNPARRSGESDNDLARTTLAAAGVEVRRTNPAFEVTHEKSMVVDDTHAFVESLNWTTEGLTSTRDYAVVTPSDPEVAEIIDCFESDWSGVGFDPGDGAHLIWCPNNGRARIADFIDRAQHSLLLQNERYQDPVIIEHLVRAARRGVKVHVMARPPHTLKKTKLLEGVSGLRILDDVGIKVHTLKHLKLHAKMILADGARAVVGSINLSPGSFDSRRELAIEVAETHVIDRLTAVAHHDWKHSTALDLSDEGLLADLSRRYAAAPDGLGLHDEIAHSRAHRSRDGDGRVDDGAE